MWIVVRYHMLSMEEEITDFNGLSCPLVYSRALLKVLTYTYNLRAFASLWSELEGKLNH